MRPFFRLLIPLLALPAYTHAAPPAEFGARSQAFVAGAEVISRPATEQYAHQSTMRIVNGTAFIPYQCNDTTPAENAPGQKIRLAIFEIHHPASTVRWAEISGSGDIPLQSRRPALRLVFQWPSALASKVRNVGDRLFPPQSGVVLSLRASGRGRPYGRA